MCNQVGSVSAEMFQKYNIPAHPQKMIKAGDVIG
jgi:hypothetical protein